MEEKLNEIIEYLRGTCMNTVRGAAEEILAREVTEDELDKIEKAVDEELFTCQICGWYCERGEESSEVFDRLGEDDVCEDCEDEYLESHSP